MISKGVLKRLEELLNDITEGEWTWDQVQIDDEGNFHVAQGSRLGNSAISLELVYENAGVDCQYVSEAAKAIPEFIESIRQYERELSDKEAIIKHLQDELSEDMPLETRSFCALHEVLFVGSCPVCLLEADNIRLMKEIDNLDSEIAELKNAG